MADLRKTIDIVLNGEDRASRQIRQVSSTLDRLGPRFATVAQGAGLAAAAITATGAAVTGLVGAGLKQAYDQSVAFEGAMIDLQKVLGDQPEAMAAAKEAALEMSNQYGRSSQDILQSTAGFVQAGFEIEESLQLVRNSLDLMIAGDLQAADAKEVLIRSLKGFQAPASEAGRLVDILNEVSNRYATDVGKLAEGMARVSPIARQMGFSMEETAGLVTPIIEVFQSGSEAGRALRTSLLRITDDSKPVQEALRTLGVEQRDANGELRSGKAILFDVAEAFQELKPNQKSFIAGQIAGKEQSARFSTVLDNLEGVLGVTEAALGSAGSAAEEVSRRLDSAEVAIQRYQTAWQNLGIAIGDQFRESATDVVEGATDITNALQEAVDSGALDEFFEQIRTLAEDFAEELASIAEATPEALERVDWSSLAEAVERVGDAFGGWFDGLDLSKSEELAQAIQRVVDGTAILIKSFATLISWGDDIASFLVALAQRFNQFSGSVLDINSGMDLLATFTALAISLLQEFYEALNWIPGIDMSGPIRELEKIGTQVAKYTLEAEKAEQQNKKLNQELDKTAQEMKKAAEEVRKGGKEVEDFGDQVGQVPESKAVELKAQADKRSVTKAEQDIDQALSGGKEVKVQPKIDEKLLEKEIASIEAAAETRQTAIEWEAKLDIQQAENALEKFETTMGSIDNSISETTKGLDKAFSYLKDQGSILSPSFYQDVQDMARQEAENRDRLMDRQAKLVEQQIRLYEQRAEAMRRGEGMVKIESDGLEPALEMVLWNILEKVQVRTNESGGEYLLGIS